MQDLPIKPSCPRQLQMQFDSKRLRGMSLQERQQVVTWIVPQGMVYERRPPERSGFDQDATAGSLTLGLSVTRASVSRLI